jgi:drug/metabolite transporter (DMT)-like permease
VTDCRPVAVLLGLGSAITYGTADFIGGLVTRRNPVARVVLISKLAGLLLYLAAFPLLIGAELTALVWGWGLAAGLAGSVGIGFLYRGLARGRMSVVAPITAVVSAVMPVAFGLAIGERPTPVQLVGVAVAILAVALVSAAPDPAAAEDPRVTLRERLNRSGVPDALASGVGIGAFLILITRAGDDSGSWPLVAARVGEIAVMAAIVALSRTGISPDPGTGKAVVTAGALDAAANLLYLIGTRLGLISVVAVLTSLYPAATVLLARVFLRDRLSRGQLVGLGLALAGVIMLTAG